MPEPKRPIHNSYWVIPGRFLAGAYPDRYFDEHIRRQMDAFLEAGFDTFINLVTPNERPPYEPILREQAGYYQMDVQHHHFPISDLGLPTPERMTAILDTIDAALAAGRTVYAHCWGGIGRTGTTVGCYLVRRGMSGEQALRQVAEWCFYAASPETETQKQFIRDWETAPGRR